MSIKNPTEVETESNPQNTIENIISTIDKLPPEVQNTIITLAKIREERSVSISGETTSEMVLLIPLMEKMDSTHITQVLTNQQKSEDRRFWDKIITIILSMSMAIIFLGILICALYLFKNDSYSVQLVGDIFKYLIGAFFGFVGGYGICHSKLK